MTAVFTPAKPMRDRSDYWRSREANLMSDDVVEAHIYCGAAQSGSGTCCTLHDGHEGDHRYPAVSPAAIAPAIRMAALTIREDHRDCDPRSCPWPTFSAEDAAELAAAVSERLYSVPSETSIPT